MTDQPFNIDDPEGGEEAMRRQMLHAAEVYTALAGQPFDDQLATLTEALVNAWAERVRALARAKAAATLRSFEIARYFAESPDDDAPLIEAVHQALYQPGLSVRE